MRRSIWITVFLILSLVFFILFYLFDPFQVPPNVTITQSNVKVVQANQHTFLIDHEKLIVVEFDGRRIDEKMGYVDPGAAQFILTKNSALKKLPRKLHLVFHEFR